MTQTDDLSNFKVWIETAAAALQKARDILERMTPVSEIKRLDVPWLSQLGPDAAYSNSDCGPACLAMWLRYLKQDVTVDQVSAATGLVRGYKFTIPQNIIDAAHRFGLTLRRSISVTLDDLKAQIDAGQPAIVLVHYPTLSIKFDPNYKVGHWVLLTGYADNGDVLYHDPYWPDSTGRFVRCGRNSFTQAMQDCSIDGNTPNQGLMQVTP